MLDAAVVVVVSFYINVPFRVPETTSHYSAGHLHILPCSKRVFVFSVRVIIVERLCNTLLTLYQ